jgi:Tol biopolymer transport system component
MGMLGNVANFSSVDLSPDGKSVVVTRSKNLWIHDIARTLATRFTFGSHDAFGVWTRDRKHIAYSSEARGPGDLYSKPADGSKGEELLYADGAAKVPTSWSPDGRFLLFFRIDPKTQRDVWVLPLGEHSGPGASSKPVPWLATPFNEFFAKFSPDGRWVAYQSDESGRNEIYVAAFPGPGGKRQLSTGGGSYPRWREDGKEIFYIGPNGTLIAAEISTRLDNIEIGAVHLLPIPAVVNHLYMYDASADGQRFLVAVPRVQQPSGLLTLVQNWTALLKKN